MEVGAVKFPKGTNKEFTKTLRKRVRTYFKENNLSKHANTNMVIKTVVMLSMYLVPLILMYTGIVSNVWQVLLAYAVIGFGVAGIGMNVMHDAVHGAYSKNETVNKILGYTICLCGGFPINWYNQHNVLHHTYTNVQGLDEDVDSVSILRFAPFAKLMKFHKLQHLFAWFLYGFMTLLWTTSKDFEGLAKYKKMGLLKGVKRSYRSFMIELIIAKIVYYALLLVLPMIILPVAWWQVLLGYLLMHFISGFTLAVVFQTAHVIPEAKYFSEEEAMNMQDNFEVTQMLTTADFAPKSRILSWFIGGLNFQIEHHLFPNICHVHYKKIAHIVKQTAEEFNIPYYCEKTFLKAVANHAKFLKALGSEEVPQMALHHHH